MFKKGFILILSTMLLLTSCDFNENELNDNIELKSNNQLQKTAEPLLAEEYPLGDIPLSSEEYSKHLRIISPTTRAPMPMDYDARNENIVTSAKNQGSCGSCWAFASVGALESHLLKKYPEIFNVDLDLSEQQQVSCNTNMYGCSGGYSSAIQFWEINGPAHESCFPYTATESSCNYCVNYPNEVVHDYKIANFHTIDTSDTDQVKVSLYEDGPSYFRYTVYSDFFTFWNTATLDSVYLNESNSRRGGHAVLIIGWDDTKGAYLCKNSWGETGGPNGDGTFWMAYDGHLNNLNFGMSNFSVPRAYNIPCNKLSDLTNSETGGFPVYTERGGYTSYIFEPFINDNGLRVYNHSKSKSDYAQMIIYPFSNSKKPEFSKGSCSFWAQSTGKWRGRGNDTYISSNVYYYLTSNIYVRIFGAAKSNYTTIYFYFHGNLVKTISINKYARSHFFFQWDFDNNLNDGSNLKFYLNGSLRSSQTSSFKATDAAEVQSFLQYFKLKCRTDNGGDYRPSGVKAIIDDIKIWDGVVSYGDITNY